jgi:DNA sulfur modification protein DndB
VSYTDTKIITTIGNLYDLVQILFKDGLKIKKSVLENFREGREREQELFVLVTYVFEYLFDTIPALSEFQEEKARESTVKKYRNKGDGGILLYRPLGLKIYFLAMCKFIKDNLENDCIEFIDKTKNFNFNLESEPFKDVLWDSHGKNILTIKAAERDELVNEILNFAKKQT